MNARKNENWTAGNALQRRPLEIGALLLALFSVGCGRGPVQYPSNSVYAEVLSRETGVEMEAAEADVLALLEREFGTPDQPRMPSTMNSGSGLPELVDIENVRRAAGPFSSDQEDVHVGLYRKHCVGCHGVGGTGQGPAAILQRPYPRDFRMGVFKYKSTERGGKPTKADLRRTLERGLPGVAMPAFHTLPEEDIDALVDYVIFLAVRGEVERRLLAIAANDLQYGEPGGETWFVGGQGEGARGVTAEQQSWIDEEIRDVAGRWQAAQQVEFSVEPPSEGLLDPEWIAAGKALFHGQVANCASCHGEQGDGIVSLPADYDDWTKEWTTKMGIDPADRAKLEPYLSAGAFKPKPLPARNLTNGVYRGGGSAEELFLRIVHGIDGTPMPAVNLVEQEGGAGLTTAQVWQLVAYVRALAGDLAQPLNEERELSGELR